MEREIKVEIMKEIVLSEKLISIIVPVYNVEQYLRRCVNSLVGQTYRNIEIILVDDGSPDRCGEICDDYAKQDSRVKVIHKPNGGLSDARNKGIDTANGDYLMFIDSDDWIEPETCQVVLQAINDVKPDTVVFGVNYVYDSGRVTKSRRGLTGLADKKECLKRLMYNISEGGIFNYACNKAFSARLFEGLRFPMGKLAEDQDVVYQLVHKSSRIYVTDRHLYNYYQRNGSISYANYYPEVIKDRHELWLKRLDFVKARYPDLKKYQLAQILATAYVSVVKLKAVEGNEDLRKLLFDFIKEHDKDEKSLTSLDKRIWLHYYCYPLFWLCAKYKAK